ncbi:MAG: hypothetical protein KFH87_12250 [Bacteroidetes bacterium]|nr:hypothetical protein [Bacteroidota bacterium]
MTVDLDAVATTEGMYTIDVSPLPRNRYILLLIGADASTQKLFIRK